MDAASFKNHRMLKPWNALNRENLNGIEEEKRKSINIWNKLLLLRVGLWRRKRKPFWELEGHDSNHCNNHHQLLPLAKKVQHVSTSCYKSSREEKKVFTKSLPPQALKFQSIPAMFRLRELSFDGVFRTTNCSKIKGRSHGLVISRAVATDGEKEEDDEQNWQLVQSRGTKNRSCSSQQLWYPLEAVSLHFPTKDKHNHVSKLKYRPWVNMLLWFYTNLRRASTDCHRLELGDGLCDICKHSLCRQSLVPPVILPFLQQKPRFPKLHNQSNTKSMFGSTVWFM